MDARSIGLALILSLVILPAGGVAAQGASATTLGELVPPCLSG